MNKPPRASWENLSQPGSAPRPTIAPDAPDTDDEMVMRVLAGGDGPRFLMWLRSRTIEKRSRSTASDGEIRWDEAQRALVSDIENAAERGREIVEQRRIARANAAKT